MTFFARFFKLTPTQDKKTVLLLFSGVMLKATPRNSFKCLRVLIAYGVSGPSLTSLISSGPNAHKRMTRPCATDCG